MECHGMQLVLETSSFVCEYEFDVLFPLHLLLQTYYQSWYWRLRLNSRDIVGMNDVASCAFDAGTVMCNGIGDD
jgi:hypothetical protein